MTSSTPSVRHLGRANLQDIKPCKLCCFKHSRLSAGGPATASRRRFVPQSYLNVADWLGGKKEDTEGLCPAKQLWEAKVEDGNLSIPPLSKTDQGFTEDGVEFVEGHQEINVDELNDLFEKVGFPRRDPAKLCTAMENTHCVFWIRSTKTTRWAKAGQLLGFARAMSDGVISASIWDVAVLPAWQRSGLGRGLMERVLVKLRKDNISNISLYAEPDVVGLYERLGFIKEPEGIRGMAFQRKSKIGMKVAMNQNS
ncbi:hypothetical protein BSKO_07574 [Bryopsis sp. KO-2023]|nr:hypothetical protein BSKO_07574 [Bryopsis sp. KO-2023]